MNIKEAIRIINYEDYEQNITASDISILALEAHRVFFEKFFSVDILNEDGSYKSMTKIFEEANKNIKQMKGEHE